MTDEEPVEHVTERMAYWWRCGACDEVNETEFDERGSTIECPVCGAEGKLTGDY